jgi:RNA polymerase sigma factor (sigma-70 family)
MLTFKRATPFVLGKGKVFGAAEPGELHATRTWKTPKYSYHDDPGLIRACLDGEAHAWDKLVERYAPLVYSIPYRMGLEAPDADDILQNVFTIVFRRLTSLQNHVCLAAWLITITRRECLHLCRRNPEHTELQEEMIDSGDHLGEHLAQHERQQLVHQALTQLDPMSQALLSALFLEVPTPSYVEIARRLNLAVGSIGPARARCLKKLELILLRMDSEQSA